MKTNRILEAIIYALVSAVIILGYQLYEARKWNDIYSRNLMEKHQELDALKSAGGITIPNPFLEETEIQVFRNQEIDEQLVGYGIAARMLHHVKLHNGSSLPPVNVGIEKCSFWVEQAGETISTVIDMPNPNAPSNLEKTSRVKILFQVEEGKSFGASNDAPLTPEQYALVKKIVER